MRSRETEAPSHYALYVPREGVNHEIWKASAIVGEARGNLISTHYQGLNRNMHIDMGLPFEWCVNHAASRRSTNYPTIARRVWQADDLHEVGSVRYDDVLRWWVIDQISDPAVLEAWAPGPHHLEGSPQLRQSCAGRLYNKLSTSQKIAVSQMANQDDQVAYILANVT